MKATLYRNIDLVRIPIKRGVSEYYLPQNVDWAAERIDKLAFCIPYSEDCADPVDGATPVFSMSDRIDFYVSLYNKEEKELLHEVHFDNLLARNNHPIMINDVLNLSLCRINFTQEPTANSTLLVYVYHGSVTKDDYDMPNKSVTATFAMAADAQLTFQEMINQYVHALPARIKGISIWQAEDTPVYLTLRDHRQTYILQSLYSELMRPAVRYFNTDAEDMQEAPLLLDDLDIDFDYSRIRNAAGYEIRVTITFYF